MGKILKHVEKDIDALVSEWVESSYLQQDDLFVIGCSTSEVAGERIGTAGSEDIAFQIFQGLQKLKQMTNVHLVFQCCEHLNRALVMEKETMETYELEEVAVIPVPSAGGQWHLLLINNLQNQSSLKPSKLMLASILVKR